MKNTIFFRLINPLNVCYKLCISSLKKLFGEIKVVKRLMSLRIDHVYDKNKTGYSESAYLYLPEHPEGDPIGIVDKSIRLSELIKNYKGPDIYVDFSQKKTIIGVRIN
jgi:hypothetical protein